MRAPAVASGSRSDPAIQFGPGRLGTDAKLEMFIYWSKEDRASVVEVPELPGCMADGPSYREALANAEVVIQEWIGTATALGCPIPEPKGRLMFA